MAGGIVNEFWNDMYISQDLNCSDNWDFGQASVQKDALGCAMCLISGM